MIFLAVKVGWLAIAPCPSGSVNVGHYLRHILAVIQHSAG
jgi:hypothetical protein